MLVETLLMAGGKKKGPRYFAASVTVGSDPQRLFVFSHSNGVFTALPIPDAPTAGVNDVRWSHSGRYLAVTVGSEVRIYKRSGSSFVLLLPAIAPAGGTVNGVAWSPDDAFLAVAHTNSPRLSIYARTGDTFTKLPNPASLPTATAHDVAFSPDGVYLAVAYQATQGVAIYKRSGSTFTRLPDLSQSAGSGSRRVVWSPDGVHFAVGLGSAGNTVSNSLRIYRRNPDDTFTRIAESTGESFVNGITYTPDGRYLIVVPIGFLFQSIRFLERSGDVYTEIKQSSLNQVSDVTRAAISDDGRYLALSARMTFVGGGYFVYALSGTDPTLHMGSSHNITGTGAVAFWPVAIPGTR